MTAAAVIPNATVTLEEAFQAHHAKVFRTAYRVTGSAADAEDVLQTVFLRLLRQGRDADSIGNLETYLCRAAVNASLDIIRSRKTPSVDLRDVEAVLSEDARLRPDRRQDAAELREHLRAAIARLTPKAAEMCVLRYFEGYGNHEIARLMQTSESDVAVTLHRSRSRLQQDIQSYIGERHER
jgi:RNA polymerase sigma-70 factor (ECF subfamily)